MNENECFILNKYAKKQKQWIKREPVVENF